ncbi:DUF551 domain-containing protein [Salmonella enterica]|nr:DUF551 domain-containing protein [Salmonella enterica subsp. enterica serovar Newport]EKJ5422716.1 DUF551 domain-containing protein [Salmonella enterica]EKJ6080034.1 DUF551 domain-containing protein [Salmonella enterica]EKS0356932.1 DUF551 domain-containing protein [Salmonella enterica]
MTTITKERIELFIKNPLENGLTRGEQMDLARIVLASLDAEPVAWECGENIILFNPDTVEAYAKRAEISPKPLFAAPPVPVVPDEWTIQDAVKFCRETGRQDAGSAMEAWNACRAAMLQGVEQPQNARQNIPENIPDGNSPVSPGSWISCSERMPDNDESKPIAIFTGKCLGQGMFVATYDDDGFFDYWEGMEIIGVTHWMPLPAAPEPDQS